MKKKSISLMAVLIVICISIPVFADTDTFRFELRPGEYERSDDVKKSDSEQKAYVNITDGTIRSGDIVWFRVRRTSDEKAMTVRKSRDQEGKFTLSYTTTGKKGTKYFLNGYEDPDTPLGVSITVIGKWTP